VKTPIGRRAGAILLTLAAAAPASGGTHQWALPSGGDFLAPSNWAGGVAPGAGDSACFEVSGGYTVTLSEDAAINNVRVDGSSPVFNFAGAQLDLELIGEPIASLIVGASPSSPAQILFVGGAITASTVFIGEVAGANGSLTVAGGTTSFVTDARVDLARGGLGALDVISGAAFESGVLRIGVDGVASGRATVAGQGTAADVGVLRVGVGGSGEFTAQGGAVVTTDAASAGVSAGSDGLITLDNAQLTASAGSDVVIGDAGVGDLVLRAGAQLNADDLVLGEEGGDGELDSQDTLLQLTGDLIVGRGGVATASLDADTSVICNRFRIATGNTSLADAEVAGFIAASVGVDVGPGAFSDGLLTLTPDATIITPTLRVFPNGELNAAGAVQGDLEVNGVVRPVAPTSITGDYRQNGLLQSGELIVTLETGNERIEAQGQADLAGGFGLLVGPGFTPETDQTYTIITAGGVTGAFDSVALPPDWTLEVTGMSVRVTYTGEPAEPADFDGDGTVGSADLGALLAAWGACAGCPEDLDGDGSVGSSDLGILLAAWG